TLAHEEVVAGVHEGGVGEDPTLAVHSKFTDFIDAVTTKVGFYVAWWAVIAVFAYYYEVVARFIFNSPTNWVHESMFLMFGMQYVLCGAYAYCEDQHVRVDVIYTKFSTRGNAIANMLPSRIFPFMTDYQLSAVPLFIFMAAVLEKAGIIEELFDVIYKWLGALKGGLASATVLACTVLAAMVGVVGATEVTMGMIALPAMLKRGYDPKLACGALLAGGTLGILIPPSVMAIVYAV